MEGLGTGRETNAARHPPSRSQRWWPGGGVGWGVGRGGYVGHVHMSLVSNPSTLGLFLDKVVSQLNTKDVVFPNPLHHQRVGGLLKDAAPLCYYLKDSMMRMLYSIA